MSMSTRAESVCHYAFFGVSALLFAASATVTILWCASMAAMGGMLMPGGWNMSMAWMRMPGQSWAAAAAMFLGMWVVMMVAMMLPYLVPALWRYREAVAESGETRLGMRSVLAGAGYFFVWTLIGLAAFPLGAALAALQMQYPSVSRATPVAAGVVVLIAGVLQFTGWKAGRLACCRGSLRSGCARPPTNTTAWRFGLRLGLDCASCCANLMALLLVLGVMDLRAMVVVAAAITLERIAPAGDRVARALGGALVATGFFLVVRGVRPDFLT
jgi:predicted metal-binding membrane protein